MKRLLLIEALLVAAYLVLVLGSNAANPPSAASLRGTYKIELDNAFGLVPGADLKVAGVRSGTIAAIGLDQKTLHAVVTVMVTRPSVPAFRADAFCISRPESLIGEYFIDCNPGRTDQLLRPGGVIPVARTQSTIPTDLVQNILRMPYRQRFSLILNELGAAVAARSGDLKAALQRAVPALIQTDNLLQELANDSGTLKQLAINSDTVITALADNKAQVQRFVREANRSAAATATQQGSLRASFQRLPAFLEQLRPALAQLGSASRTNEPVFAKLNAASGQLNRLFTDLPAFAGSSLPAIGSLGRASVTGKAAVQAAGPAVRDLNQFALHTPELAQNLSIVLPALDDRRRSVERDPRSPGGQGYTGLEALLQYVFNQTLAVSVYGPFGHILTTDAFLDPECSFYASSATIALSLAKYGPSYRHCYSWLGPSQPGINETDPSAPKACVPDPGGGPPGKPGPRTNACKLSPAAAASQIASAPLASATPTTSGYVPVRSAVSAAAGGGTPARAVAASTNPGNSRSRAGAGARKSGGTRSSASGSGSAGSAGRAAPGQMQQLLNYLLNP